MNSKAFAISMLLICAMLIVAVVLASAQQLNLTAGLVWALVMMIVLTGGVIAVAKEG